VEDDETCSCLAAVLHVGPAPKIAVKSYFTQCLWRTGSVEYGSPTAGSRGRAPVGSLGDKVPQKLKHFC